MGKNAIENAEQVIEAFGGIRPMAKKIDVAVTTVQGWKKRNVIPGTRRELILKAAAEHDVDIADLVAGAKANTANENVSNAAAVASSSVQSSSDEDNSDEGDDLHEASPESEVVKVDTPVAPSRTSEEKVLDKQAESYDKPQSPAGGGLKIALVSAILIALGFLAIATYFWQKVNNERAAEAARLAEIEQQRIEAEQLAEAAKDEQGFLGNIIPKDLNEKLTGLQEQAQALQDNIGTAAQGAQDVAQAVSNDVLAEDAGNIGERLTKLEGHLQDLTGKPVLQGMLDRVSALQVSPEGNDVLARTVTELDALFSTLGEDAAQAGEGADQMINNTLDQARNQSDALGQTLESVPQQDLKAAAMLLGMSQLRSALNRDNAAFEGDLGLLKKMVGEDNPELSAALDRLSPHAESGVLTPSGLSTELRTFAGDAVAASLSGEDVTVQERAKARMNELFSVQKDGELITGTDTQASLLKAEQQLQAGDIAGAIASVKSVDGDAGAALSPWLEKAQGSLNAQDAKGLVDGIISKAAGGGELIRNEALGINIYTPKKPVTY